MPIWAYCNPWTVRLYCERVPKIVDVEQRRNEILYALWAVIHERGIEGVTYQAVAAEAGVSVGRVQHYFATRDALVLAGAEGMVALSEAAHSDRVGTLDAAEALAALLAAPLPRTPAFRLGAAVWHAYLTRAVVDEAIAEVVRDAVVGTVHEVARLLAAAGGGGRDRNAEALRLVALSDGLTQRVLLGVTDVADAAALLRGEVARATGG